MGVSVICSCKYIYKEGTYVFTRITCKTGGEVVNFHLVWLL